MNTSYKFIAFQTIVIKEVRRFMRIWVQTLVSPVITIALYFVIFLFFAGDGVRVSTQEAGAAIMTKCS